MCSRMPSIPWDRLRAPCAGIKSLYTGDRSEIVWTDADIAEFKAAAPRRSRGLSISRLTLGCASETCSGSPVFHVGEDAIVIATGKSKQRREAIVPLYDALRQVLGTIPKRSTIILTNSKGQPWGDLASAFTRAKAAAGFDRDLHFHDLRGTAATNFYTAGLSERVIAEIMGGRRSTSRKSSAAMSADRRPRRRSLRRSIGPKSDIVGKTLTKPLSKCLLLQMSRSV